MTKGVVPPMTHNSMRNKLNLARRFDYVCIVCGHTFENLACVTAEHIVPRSQGGGGNRWGNIAPSHHRCNTLKGTLTLESAKKMILEHIASFMGNIKAMIEWLNTPVPKREVPALANMHPVDIGWFLIA